MIFLSESMKKAPPKKEYRDVIFIVDVSKAVTVSDLVLASALIADTTITYGIPIVVIYVDDEYRGCQTIEQSDLSCIYPKSRRSSDLNKAFKYINDSGFSPDLVICLTRGLTSTFPEKPDYPVAWIQFGSAPFEPPFGDMKRLTDD